jgi:chorismate mutase
MKMRYKLGFVFIALFAALNGFVFVHTASAKEEKQQTNRFPQFENDEVQVWRTVISPKVPLKMHRHDHSRIVVALTDTELKYQNDKGETHQLKWEKGTAQLLPPDPPGQLHMDINESDHPMEVMVIQLKEKGNEGITLTSYYESNAKKCGDIACIRGEIDQINEQILQLLTKRTAYVQRAGDLKLKTKTAQDRKRVNDQLEVISKKSESLGLPKKISADTFKALIENSVEFEQKYIDQMVRK